MSAGKTYLVGERGPELFMPTGSGTIVPNHRLSFGSDGGGVDEGRLARLIAREMAAALPRRGDINVYGAGTEEVTSRLLRQLRSDELMYRIGG